MKNFLSFLFCLCISCMRSQSYTPQCNGAFYALTTNTPQASNTGVVNTTSTAPFVFPALTAGLAAGPAFSFGISDPSFWVVSNDTLWYSNGFAFIKSNHSIGNLNASGIGGSANFIYALDASTGQVYQYNGSGNAAFLTTISTFTNGGLAQDLVGDQHDNFYILDLQTPQTLSLYNSSGSFLCSYSVSGISTSTSAAESFAIVGSTVNVQRGSEYYAGLISGAALSFTQVASSLNPPVDYASCAISNSFTSAITSAGGVCLSSTLNLTAVSTETGLTYAWTGPGILSATNNSMILVNSPGVYSCTLQSTGCIPKSSVSIYTVLLAPTISITGNTIICSGQSTSLTAGGALSYTWSPGAITNSVITISPPTLNPYQVMGSAANGCVSSASVVVVVNSNPVLNGTASQPSICAGASTSLSVTGASVYSWNPGGMPGTLISVNPVSSTNYTVTGTDANGCVSTANVPIIVNAVPVITGTAFPQVICIGNTTSVSANGAIGYTWNPGVLTGSTVVLTPSGSLNYTVTGVDVNGCVNNAIVSVTVNPLPVLTANAFPQIICNGNITSLSATGAISYTWNPGNIISPTLTQTPGITTTYTVTGTNANGCYGNAEITVTVNPNPVVTASGIAGGLCSGNSGNLNASGASTYTWNPGNITGSIIVVSPSLTTTYTVTGESLLGCTTTVSLVVTVTATPVLATVANPTVICTGNSSTITVAGASGYTWSAGSVVASSINVSPVLTSNYTVIGANGTCTSVASASVLVNPNPTLTLNNSPGSICSGSSNTLSSSGAATYTWNPGNLMGTAVVISPIATTVYTVTASYSTSCSSSLSTLLSVTLTPTVTALSNTSAICAGKSATLTASGASTYNWVPGNASFSTFTVSPGAPTIYTVTGANGICLNSQTLNLNVINNPVLAPSAINSTICSGKSTTLNVTGAASYTWLPPGLNGFSISVSPFTTTSYTVSGTNLSGCSSTAVPLTITVSASPTVTATFTPAILCSNVAFTAYATGATSYSWLPTAFTGSIIIDAAVSSRTLNILGSTGSCTNITSFPMVVSPDPTLTIVPNPTILCIDQTATVTAGGAYTYSYDSPPYSSSNLNTATISFSASGSYPLVINGTSSLGCGTFTTFWINVVPGPTVIISAAAPLLNNLCNGSTATLSSTGANSYTWQPGGIVSTSILVTPSITTMYSVTATGSTGCLADPFLYTVSVTPVPTITTASPNYTTCQSSMLSLSANGATNYTWSPGSLTGGTINVFPVTNTIYTITGANGNCIATKTISIFTDPNPTLSVASLSGTICSGNSFTFGAVGANNYTWFPSGILTQTISVNPIVTTIYSVSGTDSFGCGAGITTTTVFVTTTPTLIASANTTVQCAGSAFSLTASGASVYNWSPGNLSSAGIVVLPGISTTYTVVGSNINCTDTKTINLLVNPLPTLSINNTSPVSICSGSTISLFASGAVNYTWNPGNLNVNNVTLNPSANTNYTLTGSDSFPCTNTLAFAVNVLNSPTIIASSSNSLFCEGETLTLTASGANTYTWNNTTQSLGVLVITQLTTTMANNYVVGTGVNGCVADTVKISVNIQKCDGFIERNSSGGSIKIFPNPNSGEFTLEWNNFSIGDVIEMYNSIGELVYTKDAENFITTVDFKDKVNGIYTIIVKRESVSVARVKIIKN